MYNIMIQHLCIYEMIHTTSSEHLSPDVVTNIFFLRKELLGSALLAAIFIVHPHFSPEL